MKRLTSLILASSMMLSANAAYAQDAAPSSTDPKINTVIIFGEDECPPSTDDQINVCAILVEGDRYRIPAPLRSDPNNPKNEAWMNRVLAYQHVAADGTMSCSASGAGGFTGCGLKQIDMAYAEKEKDPGLAFGRMIAEERKKRLAMIDAEAEEVEKRVVQFEKERAEKEAREAENGAQPMPEETEALPNPE
jgi:hypothetical protein